MGKQSPNNVILIHKIFECENHDKQCGSSIEMIYHVIWTISIVITTLKAQVPYPKTSMKHTVDLHEGAT